VTDDDKSKKKLGRKMILLVIEDLGSGNVNHYESAYLYIHSIRFSMDCENAGYPPELLDTLKEMGLLSKTERASMHPELIATLNKFWQ